MKLLSTRKKLLIASLLFVSTTALASAANYKDKPIAPCPTVPSLTDGFYVGLQGGYDAYRVKLSDDQGTSINHLSSDPAAWVGGGFAGYGKYLNTFYLGGEVFINSGSGSNTSRFTNSFTSVSGSQKISFNESYGIAILPGIKFTESVLSYVRLGYKWSKMKAVDTISGSGDDHSASTSNTSKGFQYGVGVETLVPQISNHVSMRVEYTHTNLSAFSVSGGDFKFSPSDNLLMLGVIYHI